MFGHYLSFFARRGSPKSLIRTSSGLAIVGLGGTAYYALCGRPIYSDFDDENRNGSTDLVHSYVSQTLSNGWKGGNPRFETQFVELDPVTGVNCYYMAGVARCVVYDLRRRGSLFHCVSVMLFPKIVPA